ncbi:aspartate carbamoyltransferase catalytic subunit [Natronobacillus azotifigens]|uniref:Aspartate carbamoyltransferase n=1 Tax=Natronobacillus azotifigens TaxID=472978 RepID=A0A9J6RCD8_9BACI|nr:aspartate carbamoyltransferase catalytic subunit [Natronobacillus azotifigens]MCZ0703360.1 aspartate carbamoyltransferase catalytic subunit [Natronobacillus azotifigens]
MNNFVSMKEMSAIQIHQLLKTASDIERNGVSPLSEQLFAANLFFEPSTRTKMSFVVAEKKLGLEVLDFDAGSSSLQKGESVYDTAKTLESIGANLLVVRHPVANQVQQLAKQLTIPVINAGDGAGEHPTQCLLDLYTMYQEFQSFQGLNVLIVGDVVHSRVARSNAYALKTLGANVYFSSKPQWQDAELDFPYLDLDEAIEMCDVVMLLRIQLERHEENTVLDQDSYLAKYGLTIERERKMKDHAIILHPAPVNRGIEIADQLVECERSRIFTQMKNGVTTRMAVIQQLLQSGGTTHVNHFNQFEANFR